MNVLDIMSRDVVTIHKSDTLATAIEIMDKAQTRHLAVVTANGDLVGILSDRDCRLALQSPFAVYQEESAENFAGKILVSRFMTRTPYIVGANASVQEVAQIMLEHRISAVPVMQDNNLIGIVTSTDLLKVLVAQPL